MPNKPDNHRALEEQLAHLEDLEKSAQLLDELKQYDTYPQIGKFQIQKSFSAQTNSKVFLAFDIKLKRQVVIKFYIDDTTDSDSSKILEEAQAIAQIDHPHVAKCHSVEQIGDFLLLVMEFVSEQNLYEKYRDRRPSVPQALKIIRQLNEGLSAIHKRQLLHRDLKPENIVIDEYGNPKIIDFGLAETQENKTAHEIVGTVSYLPPERLNNWTNKIGTHTDIFGLGGILYFLLTGKGPYEAATQSETNQQVREGVIESPGSLNQTIPSAVSTFCMDCLRSETTYRLQNTDEVERALKRLELRRGLKRNFLLFGLLLLVTGGLYWGSSLLFAQSGKSGKSVVAEDEVIRQRENDFEISASFLLDSQGLGGVDRIPLNQNLPAEFTAPPEFLLEIIAEKDCFVSVIGFEPKDPKDTSQGFEPYPIIPLPGQDAIQVLKGQAKHFEISDAVASKGTDYLVVYASTIPWKFQNVNQLFDRDAENLKDTIFWRGVRQVKEKRSVVRFPYQMKEMN